MNPDKENESSGIFKDYEAMVTLSNLNIYSTEFTTRIYAINELYRRVMGKKSVEDLHPVGSVGYCRELDKKDPEYHPGDRFREFYMRDESFEKGGFKYGTKVRIDTHDIRRTGLVCVQIGEYPLLALVQESADKVLFTFPNPFISCFSCSKQNLDQTVKFIGVPVFDT